jgi:hypothetical protein
MQIHLIDIGRDLTGLLAGGLIGFAFGTLQQAALRQNEKLEQCGKLQNGWSLMPGAGVRVAYLLVTLAVVQFVCPLLFVDGTQWWVSAGVIVGYGWMLYHRLRLRLAQQRVN